MNLYHPERFREHLGRIVAYKNRLLAAMLDDFEPFDAVAVAEEYLGYAERMRPYVGDATAWLHKAVDGGKRLLFEGAQGSLLDIDHGTFPYVTSSNSSAAGIAAGSGVPTRHIDRWIGIVKAYTTRVGGGPFPTEQDNEIGERIRKVGKEYGTVTGRPRRCGWFDAVAVRHSARVSGSTEISVMLLDVLSGIDPIQVAVGYEDDRGRPVVDFPACLADLETCRPVYETLPGWKDDITGARTWDDLPVQARNYVDFLAKQVGVPVSLVSVGPDRTQTIRRIRGSSDLEHHHARKDWSGSARWGSGPSNSPGTSRSSWTATAAGPRCGASRGSSDTVGGSRASGRSSRRASASGSTS